MQKKGSDSAEVKVSLKIALSKAEDSNIKINDLDGMREVLIPRFDHKVASVLQIKDEASGTLGGNFELVFDENRKSWIMREIIGPQNHAWKIILLAEKTKNYTLKSACSSCWLLDFLAGFFVYKIDL